MRRLRRAGSTAILWLVAGGLAAQGTPLEAPRPEGAVVSGASARDIDEYLTRCVPFGFSGSVLVVKDGAVILSRGYGVADRESGALCEPKTIFDLGSLTKQFTASAVLVLEQRKKLKTKDTLDKFLPDVPADKAKIQLHHLLSHTAGLPRGIDGVGSRMESRDELIQAVLRVPLRDPPGTEFTYSNVGYDLLAAIVEIVTAQPFEQALQELVFEPSGLTSTGFRKDGKLAAALAARSWMKPDDPPPAGSLLEGASKESNESGGSDERELATDGWYSWGLRGAGGVLSTVEDLWRWEQVLRSDALLTKESKKKLFTPVLENYAYGWYALKSERKTAWIEHGGTTESGFDAKIARFPDENAYVVMLGNVPDLVPWVNLNVHGLLFGKTCTRPPATQPLAPEELSAFAGEYENSKGARWRVSARGANLVLEARTPQALEFRTGKLSGDLKHIVKQSEKVVAGFAKANFAELHALETEHARFGYMEGWWRRMLEHHGPLRATTVLGVVPDPDRTNRVVVLLEFERGEELLRLDWGPEDLLGLNIGPPYPSRLCLVPDSNTGFVWFDLVRGKKTVAARFTAEGGLELTLSGVTLALMKR